LRGIRPNADLAILGGAWVVLALLVNPRGEFPLNDDWAYALPVKRLLETGCFKLTDWGAMTLVAHVAWGVLVALPFGFSFLALRLGTLVLGALGIAACNGVFREAGFSRRSAFTASAVVALNPLYFLHSYTFMTDVPFFAAAMGAVYFWMRWLRTRSPGSLTSTLILLVLAILVRQVAMGLALGLTAGTIFHGAFRWRRAMAAGLLFLVPVAVYFAYKAVARATFGLPYTYMTAGWHLVVFEHDPVEGLRIILPFVYWRVVATFIYLGLFCLPFALAHCRFTFTSISFWISLGVSAGAVYTLISTGRLFPHFGILEGLQFPSNTLAGLSLGPPTLSDSFLVGHEHIPQGSRVLRTVVTLAGALGGVWILHRLLQHGWDMLLRVFCIRRGDDSRLGPPGLFLAMSVAGCLYFGPFLLSLYFFDRYMLLLVPLVLVLLGSCGRTTGLPRPGRFSALAGAGLLGILGLFSVAGTHDYLAWNRTRWDTARYLVQDRGMNLGDLDAGFEFNAWHRYRFPGEGRTPSGDSWNGTRKVVLAFGPLKGYEILEVRHFDRWLPGGPDRIFILVRG